VAERLVKKGHEVTIFATNSNVHEDLNVLVDQPVDVDGVNVWYFRHEEPIKNYLPFIPYLSKSVGFLYAPRMRSQLDRLVPAIDIIHTHLPFIYPTYAASRAALRYKKPLFYSQRGVFSQESLKFRNLKKRLYISAVERPILKRATTLIALTQHEVASYRSLGLKTPCKIIPNGIDLPDNRHFAISYYADNYGILPDDIIILFMARLHPSKGIDKLIQSFIRIHSAHPCLKLVVAGPDEYGMIDKYRMSISSAGISRKVIFPGMITGETKSALLSRADLFCLPSNSEGFSMAILEAMANRVAVLISPECHFPEVDSFGAGVIVESTIDSLVQAISHLAANKHQLELMGKNGYRLVQSRYGWDNIVDTLISTYQEGIQREHTVTQMIW
jgi:glycosyltransferase involved in cell wall biosynthesis